MHNKIEKNLKKETEKSSKNSRYVVRLEIKIEKFYREKSSQ